MDNYRYTIVPFDKASHDREAFSCGVDIMDNWFKTSISDQIKNNRLRVWCALDAKGSIAGFYGLSAHSIEPDNAPELATRGERNQIPAIYLVALATDTNAQGQGLGGALMADAMVKSFDAAEKIGASAIILDVFDDTEFNRRMKFYIKLGFKQIDPDNNSKRLYLPMKEIKNILAS